LTQKVAKQGWFVQRQWTVCKPSGVHGAHAAKRAGMAAEVETEKPPLKKNTVARAFQLT